MRQDTVSIDRFYHSSLGQAAGKLLAGRITDLWPDTERLSMLGIGFPMPVLDEMAGAGRRCVAAIPDGSGHFRWDATGRGNATVIAPQDRLPFADGQFDRVILLHGLEEADSPRTLRREIWRVMAPEGRIVVATANRRGIWALAERTPFGHGRPWTRRQLVGFLSDGSFQVTASTHALFLPPINQALVTAAADGWERIGEWVAPALGGVVLVEAVKRLYIEPGGAVAPAINALPARKGAAILPIDQAARASKSDRR
ncbi:MAG: methyltransferase domain-containing protein [Pseudomonadota bacterium]